MRPSAKLLLLPIVSLLFGVAASSQANEALFSKSSRTLERLWSGILGCHDPADANAGFALRNRFDSDWDIPFALDEPERRDYAACARQFLRNSSSRMLVETIEDGIRHGGVALLGERFRLDSSVSWVWGESVRGELDAVIPIWEREHFDETGSALFMQHGAVLWNGLQGSERIDANFGLVYRSNLNADTVAGGSFFYDHDFKHDHKRLGVGVDVQSGIMHFAANYYHPISNWREGRENHEEQALQGADFSLGFVLDRVRLNSTLGVWRYEDRIEQNKDDWRPSFDVEGGFQVLPGVFLKGGYEHHKGKNSPGSRWHTGLAFRFSLPSFQGATIKSESTAASRPSLWRTARREKRILYEERVKVIPSVVSIGTIATIEEGGDPLTMTFTFNKPLEREVTVVLAPTSDSTANPDDYTLIAQAIVTPPISLVGEEFSAGAQTESSQGRIEIILPRHTTSLNVTLVVNDDEASETDELVKLSAYTTGENAQYARFDGVMQITIPHNDDFTIGFADAFSSVKEDAGTVYLLLRLGRTAPVGGVSVSVDATGATSDIASAFPISVTVPEGTPEGQVAQSVASIAVDIIDDNDAETAETVIFTISEGPNFPASPWRLGPNAITHTLSILTSDQPKGNIGFAPGNPTSANEGETITLTVMSSATADADLPVTWTAAPANKAQTATGTVTIENGSDSQTFFLNVNDDASGSAGSITVTLAAPNLPDGWSLGAPTHTIAIINNDPTRFVGITNTPLEATLTEPSTITIDVIANDSENFAGAASGDVTLGVELSTVGDPDILAPEYRNDPTSANDYTVGNLVIDRETGTGSFTFTVEDDDIAEGREIVTIALTDPDGNLPDGWSISAATSQFTVTVPANDNAARFSEWPRNNPGNFAGLSASVMEGEENNLPYFNVLIDHIAPEGGLPLLVSVPDEHVGDIDLELLDPERAEWNSANNNFLFLRNGNIRRAPNIAAGLRLRAVNDDEPEPEETFDITLMEASDWPGEWGGVANTPDIVNPALATATTFSVTIPANGNTISFADFTSLAIEDAGTHNVPVRIERAFPEPVTLMVAAGGNATNGIDYTFNPQIVIPADSTTANIVVTLISDMVFETNETIDLTVSGTLPEGWSFGGNTHRITVIDDDSGGDAEFTSSNLQATLSESDTITIDVSVTNRASFIAVTSANVELDVKMTVVGDPDITAPALRNDPESANDYTVGSIVINHETGTGSFTFTAEDDNIPEGREIITLTLTDPNGNLPDRWDAGGERNSFTIIVPGNDNAARFAEWPRNDPGNFAGLSLTLEEGATNDPPRANFIVLIDHIAPDGDLPFLLSVPDEYRNDIGFRNVEDNRTGWDSASSVFTFRRNGSIQQAPNIAAGLEIFAVADDDPEGEETFEIMLMEAPGWPGEWGGVANTPDIVNPALATATTLSVTIPANGNTVSFADLASSAIEDAGTHNVPVRIERVFPEPVMLTVAADGTATNGNDYTVNPQIVIPANNSTANIVVTLVSDTVFEANETIDLTISGTLPEGWNFGSNTHRITVINDDPGGFVEFASDNLQATLSESDTITINVSVTNGADFIAATSANVELDVEMTAAGEPEIVPHLRNNPESVNDYTIGNLVINHETGTGSFTFTAEDDNIPEGREIITLALADPDDNLPDEWNINDARSRFTVTVPGNDNAARFAEWPRNDPGSFTGLSLTLAEGAINDPPRDNFIVLIDHIAPGGNLPFLLSVPDEYRDDIGFRNVENRRTEWDSASGVFTFRRSGSIRQAPNIAAGLEIFAVADDDPEREETFEITLMEAPGWPGEWGGVANTPDIVNPALATATTLSVTIPANGNIISFADFTSSAIEDAGTHNVPIRIERAFPEPVTLTVAAGGNATNGTDYTVNPQIVIPADNSTANIVVTLISDTVFEADEIIYLTISGALPEGWSFGGNNHRITVINDDSGGVVEFAPGNLQATLPESDTITIDVSVTNGVGFIAATSSNIELDVEMTAAGDPDVVLAHRNDPESANDYTIGNLVINHETGTGSFTFTAEDDNIPEGREIITLALADPDGNLPNEWNINDARSRFTVIIPGNDNVARFAEWPRNDPGSFSGLSLNLEEGATNDPPRANFIVLIDHIAPDGDLPFLLSVPDEYRDDIGFRTVENSRTGWDSASGVFTFKRNGNIRQAPNIAAGLEIFAVADDDPEEEETFEITLMEAPGWPSEWGGVVNAPDIVNPALATATTLSVTILANGNTISFAESASSAIENAGTHNVPVRIERAFPEPVTLTVVTSGTATDGIDYTVESQIVIPANSATANVSVILNSDSVVEIVEYIDLTISGTLPEGWDFGDITHRVAIVDSDSGGVVEIAHDNRHATLSEPDTISIDVSVTNGADFIAATLANIELDIEMTTAGEPEILPHIRNDPESANDYTIGNIVINHETATGSFTFTVEDDNVPEGKEIVVLRLADPGGNLPSGWSINNSADNFTITVPGNDNAARFAEWPRNNPGSFSGLSLTLAEGATNDPPRANFIVLIDHIAPDGDLPFLLSVPDEYRNDIGFRNVENSRTGWDSASGVFTFKRNGSIRQAPNIAAGLEIFAVADDDPEEEETFEVTLTEAPGWPSEWGGVVNTPDIVNPALATATTLSVTIPANGNTISFAESSSSAIEDTGTHNVPVRIDLTFPEPITLEVATGGTATNGIDYTVESQIVIPASSTTADVSITLVPDSAAELNETIELSISGTLPNGWSFGNSVHRFTILDDDSSGVVEITNDPLRATLAESDTITINVALTNSTDFMVATPTDVELDVEMTAVGDPDVVLAHRNDPISANDYTVGNLVIDRETGTGSFTFTVEDDDIAEGKEIITLEIKDADGRLPYGWLISNTKNEFTITVPGNDNALRFSEWPRNDPGSFAGLSATVAEGETSNINLLIDHIAPEGGLSFFLLEPEETFNEYTITSIDYSRIRIYKGGQTIFLRNGNINQEPNLAGGIKIRVIEDEDPELEKTFDIRLVELLDWPGGWGSIMNAPDTGTPAVATSSTFSITIPASDNTISFAESASRTAESLGTHNVPVHIHHPFPEPVTLAVTAEGSATSGSDYTVDSQIVIPADSETANVAVTLIPDSALETNEYIDLTIGGTLPNGWSFDNTTHRITILDGEPKGFVEIANTSLIATLTEPGEITVDVIVTNSENLAAATSEEDILLEVELTAAGDLDITSSEFRNDPKSEDDYTVGNFFIDYKTGMGSFTFTVEDDDIPEGRETVTLALKDPDGNLPDGWLISDTISRFTVTVPANDNAARFILGPFDNLENFTNPDADEYLQPTVTVVEGTAGDPLHLNIFIDHIAPNGGLPLFVSVPDEYNNDIGFESVDDRRAEWDSTNNNFLFLRETNIDQKANLTAGLRILTEDDDEPEPEETFDIMLMEAPGWPSGWGSVIDAAPSLFSYPFTTLSVIIPANDNTATFAPTNPVSVADNVGMMDLAINLTNNAPAGGLPLTLTAAGDIDAISFDETNPDVITRDFSIAEGASSGQVTVYIQPDDDNDPESVTFTLTEGPGFPSVWGGIPTGETFTLNVTEPDPIVGTIAFASPQSEFTEPASENAFHFVPINVTGTLPPGGFPLMVAVDSASTADDSDYSVTPPLPNVLVGNTTVVDGVLTLNFSVFADDIPETDETLQLYIPADQTLPRGWRVVFSNTHIISIPDNDEFITSSGESGTELTGQTQTGQRRREKR